MFGRHTRHCQSLLRFAAVVCVFTLGACASADDDPAAIDEAAVDEVAETPPPMLIILKTLGFTKVLGDGKAEGFNLDKRISSTHDKQTCKQKDLVAPDGTKGIDNQFAKLVPLLEQTQIGAIHGLVQNAIEDGGLLILLQLEGLDSQQDDDTVMLRIRLGRGKPLLGTDGLVLSGQTFELHPESPEIAVPAAVKGGVLRGGPFKIRLPIIIFDVLYELTVHDALIRFEFDGDGGVKSGLMGGGVPITDIMTIAYTAANNGGGIIEAIEPVVTGMGDLNPDADGKCRRLSATLDFSGVSAFLFDQE